MYLHTNNSDSRLLINTEIVKCRMKRNVCWEFNTKQLVMHKVYVQDLSPEYQHSAKKSLPNMSLIPHLAEFTCWRHDMCTLSASLVHYNDVIMGTIASQITHDFFYSTVYSDADQRKHQSSASLVFVRGIHRGPVNSPHKWPVTRKMFPFDDVIMQCQLASHRWITHKKQVKRTFVVFVVFRVNNLLNKQSNCW